MTIWCKKCITISNNFNFFAIGENQIQHKVQNQVFTTGFIIQQAYPTSRSMYPLFGHQMKWKTQPTKCQTCRCKVNAIIIFKLIYKCQILSSDHFQNYYQPSNAVLNMCVQTMYAKAFHPEDKIEM